MPRKPKIKVLPEVRVRLTRCTKGEKAVPLDYPKNLGLRSKLGGEPDWIQCDEVPECESCGSAMSFVAQIDSIEHEAANNPLAKKAVGGKQDYMFGDVGMIYVFFCFDCCETKSVIQCY